MSKRKIYIAGIDKWVTLGQYIKAVKTAKAHPDSIFPYGLTCWWSCTGAEIMQQFISGVNERINSSIPYIRRHTILIG